MQFDQYLIPKYLNLVSSRLRNFKRVADHHWRFSCPFCGDSKTDKTKARGEVFSYKSKYFYKCHNCGKSSTAEMFVKFLDSSLYQEMRMESLRGGVHSGSLRSKVKYEGMKPVFNKKEYIDITKNLTPLELVDSGHPAWQLVFDRKIPEPFWSDFKLADSFHAWRTSVQCGDTPSKDEERLVIPYRLPNGECCVAQGRALGYSKSKYITVKHSEDDEKIWGLDRIDPSKPVIVLEGPFDAMFLPNAVASGDANLSKCASRFSRPICVFDNEPRNWHIVRYMQKALDMGLSVCIWPDWVEEKDINDMVLSGMTVKELIKIIVAYTYKGMRGALELSRWKKTERKRSERRHDLHSSFL